MKIWKAYFQIMAIAHVQNMQIDQSIWFLFFSLSDPIDFKTFSLCAVFACFSRCNNTRVVRVIPKQGGHVISVRHDMEWADGAISCVCVGDASCGKRRKKQKRKNQARNSTPRDIIIYMYIFIIYIYSSALSPSSSSKSSLHLFNLPFFFLPLFKTYFWL